MAREKVKWCENCAMLEKMYLDAKAMHDTQVGDIRALREENVRLRQRVEELERAIMQGRDIHVALERRAEAAEAKLARVVEAADALLSYLQQLELLTYEPADWENPTVVEFKAALAAAKGE